MVLWLRLLACIKRDMTVAGPAPHGKDCGFHARLKDLVFPLSSSLGIFERDAASFLHLPLSSDSILHLCEGAYDRLLSHHSYTMAGLLQDSPLQGYLVINSWVTLSCQSSPHLNPGLNLIITTI